MPRYEILVTIHGWGTAHIEAESEEAAREMFDDAEWDFTGSESVQYELETIEEVKAKEEK